VRYVCQDKELILCMSVFLVECANGWKGKRKENSEDGSMASLL
jgi:hypothetical protein